MFTQAQVDRFLDVFDRYVRVQEKNHDLTVSQLKIRNAQEDRAIAAQERQAEPKIHVVGDVKTTHVQTTREEVVST